MQPAVTTVEEMASELEAGRLALWCDLPLETELVGDGLLVTGWAFSTGGVDSVEVVVDDRLRYEAKRGVERGDTVSAFPGVAGIEQAGFTCGVPESDLAPGRHSLVVVATDPQGRVVGTAREFSYRDYDPAAPPPADAPWSGERLEPATMPPHPATGEHHARYRWAAQLAPGRAVLDAGCGVGWGSELLDEAGAASVTGIDISAGAIERARAAAGGQVEFVVGDLESLPFEPGSFDLITCFEAIEHVGDPERALDELKRVLRPGGVLLISSPNRGVYDTPNPWHVREYSSAELESTLASRFGHVELRRQQTHFASALTGEEALGASDGRRIGADLRKLVGGPPGSELFAVAAASDGPLPELDDLVLLGDLCPGFVEQATEVWRTRAGRAASERELERASREDAEREARELAARIRVSAGHSAGESVAAPPGGPTLFLNRPTPAASPVAAVVGFWGAVLSAEGIDGVEVAVEGLAPVSARRGLRRPDLAAAFPALPSAATAGWMAMLDVSELSPGAHRFEVRARASGAATATVAGTIDVDPDLCYRIWREIRSEDPPPGPAGESCRFLVCPVPGPPGAGDGLTESLQAQTHSEWELAETGGIGTALEAVAAGRADLALLVRSCDRLEPEALLAFAGRAVAAERPDVLYCDDDRLAPGGGRTDPRLKPGWSPELLAERDYVGPCVAVGPAAAAVALERGAAAASGTHDLLLRLVDAPLDVVRIPRVLYSRGAPDPEVTPPVPTPMETDLLVSIVIPTRLAEAELRAGIDALLAGTAYRPLELVVVDTSDAGLPPLGETAGDVPLTVVRDAEPFNFSRACNLGVAQASGDHVLLLNDDVTPLGDGWLGAMVDQALRPGVGAVGAKLLYPGGTVQHAGVIVHPAPLGPAHLLSDLPGDAPGPHGALVSVRNCSAVTGACMLVPRDLYGALRGLDERFALYYGDIDLCLRLLAHGKRVVWTPHALLEHRESATIGAGTADDDGLGAFHARWGRAFAGGDPYYNPGLSRDLHYELLGAVA